MTEDAKRSEDDARRQQLKALRDLVPDSVRKGRPQRGASTWIVRNDRDFRLNSRMGAQS